MSYLTRSKTQKIIFTAYIEYSLIKKARALGLPISKIMNDALSNAVSKAVMTK